MFKTPLVSFVVTSYNYEKYILRTLESIKNQSYSNFEIIVVDDCSNDNSCKIVENFIEDNQDLSFLDELNNNRVTEVSITPRSRAGIYEIEGKLSTYAKNETFTLTVPLTDSVIKQMLNTDSSALNYKLITNSDPESSSVLLILINVLIHFLLY